MTTIRQAKQALVRLLLAPCAIGLLQACGDQRPDRTPPTPASAPPAIAPPAISEAAPIAAPGKEFTVVIRDVVRIPASRKSPPSTRINFLFHAGDGSGRLFVGDLEGRIHVIRNEQLLPEPFLDMARVRGPAFTSAELFEQGLSSFAFHPDFAQPGKPGFRKVYTSSTETPASGVADLPTPDPSGRTSHHNVLAEWSVNPASPDTIDPASRREVLRIAHPLRDHVMGQIAFNPNARASDKDYGMLYIAVGDGGNTVPAYKKVDAMRNGQNKLNPFGKILRINPLQSGASKYTIPPDNPFMHDAAALKEIWAYGLRNPQRFSWDTGGDRKMIIADVGQNLVEEVNVGAPGANYGWGEREGNLVVNRDDETRSSELPPNDAALGFVYPAASYGHDLGNAIAGGFVYRGRAVPELQGKYLFGDIVMGRIFHVDAASLVNGRPAAVRELKLSHLGRQRSLLEILAGERRADLRFGTDERGEIYLLTQRDGAVRKLSIAMPIE